jgi:hypothetical protein
MGMGPSLSLCHYHIWGNKHPLTSYDLGVPGARLLTIGGDIRLCDFVTAVQLSDVTWRVVGGLVIHGIYRYIYVHLAIPNDMEK